MHLIRLIRKIRSTKSVRSFLVSNRFLECHLHTCHDQAANDIALRELAVFLVQKVGAVERPYDPVEKGWTNRKVRVHEGVWIDRATNECERVESIHVSLANLR